MSLALDDSRGRTRGKHRAQSVRDQRNHRTNSDTRSVQNYINVDGILNSRAVALLS